MTQIESFEKIIFTLGTPTKKKLGENVDFTRNMKRQVPD